MLEGIGRGENEVEQRGVDLMSLEKFVAPTARRVERVSSRSVSRENRRDAELRVASLARRIEDIEERLRALDREWDIERTIQLNAGVVTLAMVGIAAVQRKAFFLPAIVGGFLI